VCEKVRRGNLTRSNELRLLRTAFEAQNLREHGAMASIWFRLTGSGR